MSARKYKVLFIALLALVLIVLIHVLINTYFITKDYLYGPPLRFLQNRYLSVDIYPRGFQSATVFTNNHIEGKTTVEDIAILRPFLKKRNIRGVFFVIPNFGRSYPLDQSPGVVEELRKLRDDGHEIAQMGTYHTYGPDLAGGSPPGGELVKLSYDEQQERIEEGKEMLTRLGFAPAGFRAPEYLSNPETLRVLEAQKFLYSSNSFSPRLTLATLFRPSLTKGVLYPQHPDHFDLLEFADQADPTFKYAKCVKLFKTIHDLKGVFVYHTFMGNIALPERLQLLDKFLDVVQKENTWCCTLAEISQWWLARESLRVETKKEGETFLVTMINKTPYPLPEMGIRFLKYPYGVKEYQILDQEGEVLNEGTLPVRETITVTVPSSPAS